MWLEEVLKTTKENKQIAPVSGASCKIVKLITSNTIIITILKEKSQWRQMLIKGCYLQHA